MSKTSIGVARMCQVPKRSWREALHPVRVCLGFAAVVAVVVGTRFSNAVGVALIGMAAALLLAAVALPVVREVEFGFPSGVRVVAATQDREERLRSAFEDQKQDLSLLANLLCDDPDTAARLLEAALARSVAKWRGPITPDLRVFVLCTFLHLLTAHLKWAADAAGASSSGGPLSALPLRLRTAVVLREFAELSPGQIAQMTGRSLTDLKADLLVAEAAVAGL